MLIAILLLATVGCRMCPGFGVSKSKPSLYDGSETLSKVGVSNVARSARALFEEVMKLDAKERIALTGLLIESLDPESEEGVEQTWVAEIERRITELDAGTVQPIPWDELRMRLYGGLRVPDR